MKQVYVDLDSTLNNHWVRIQKWALPNFPGKSINPNAFTRKEIMNDKPLPYALESIREISKRAEVHILSARNFKDAFSITEDWLTNYGFKFKSVNIVKSSIEKPSFLSGVDVDLLIDDFSAGQEYGPSYLNLYLDTIDLLNKLQIDYVIFDGDWNKAMYKVRKIIYA